MKRHSAKQYRNAKICPYCSSVPRYDKNKKKYICPKCGAKVNADSNGKPLGSVANKTMAYKRWYAHSMIEPLGKKVGRSNVYRYITSIVGKNRKVHMAQMSELQLDIVINILENTTVEKLKERLGLVMNKEDIKVVVKDVLKETYEPLLKLYDERIKILEFDRAFIKFQTY